MFVKVFQKLCESHLNVDMLLMITMISKRPDDCKKLRNKFRLRSSQLLGASDAVFFVNDVVIGDIPHHSTQQQRTKVPEIIPLKPRSLSTGGKKKKSCLRHGLVCQDMMMSKVFLWGTVLYITITRVILAQCKSGYTIPRIIILQCVPCFEDKIQSPHSDLHVQQGCLALLHSTLTSSFSVVATLGFF